MMKFEIRSVSRAFETVADFDPHLALVRRDDQQHAVVVALLADLPVTPELIAVILNWPCPPQRFQRDHDKLIG